ncbi:hypothetical protein [Rhizobium ruizarguesonis]|nr:hypothetical protein [Rhizobium ruizarguesonis]
MERTQLLELMSTRSSTEVRTSRPVVANDGDFSGGSGARLGALSSPS